MLCLVSHAHVLLFLTMHSPSIYSPDAAVGSGSGKGKEKEAG